ncbi:YheU family protein [Methyloterricola oryzae]|uniref:YheU family protein n=1 Tax=Methyloterricola oryzae TaxID=1495050 RepID=UPI0005EB55B3|nr:YheU family protein [Methyloterricola oryzae]
MLIPHDALSPDALQGLLEEFATRDVTDYGDTELSLSAKLELVKRQLQRGEAFIVFCEQDESVSIVTKQQLRELGLESER